MTCVNNWSSRSRKPTLPLSVSSALCRNPSARSIALYNQVWTGLRDATPLEADGYHERILELARAHGIPARANALVLDRLRDAAERRLGPECYSARELLPS